ncbi:MAG: nucleoside hydrolase [Lentisphaeria bacterium]|nr:nucleoside hydrolase [Lentisphaeria bacterium]
MENKFDLSSFKRPCTVVLDTDTYNEIDDQFALLYSLYSPEDIRLAGVTAAPFHNNRSENYADGMEKSYQEICRILKMTGKEKDVPALRGSTGRLPDRHTPVESEAADFLIAQGAECAARGERLIICAIGALTNVASALLKAPELKEQSVVVWLGGHILSHSEAREFNLQGDVTASQTVFSCGVPLIQIPCIGVASDLQTTLAGLREQLPSNPVGNYLLEIFSDYMRYDENAPKVIWDISAVAAILRPEIFRWEIAPAPILTDNCTWQGEAAHVIKRAEKLDSKAIFDDLFAKIHKYANS